LDPDGELAMKLVTFSRQVFIYPWNSSKEQSKNKAVVQEYMHL
jgi:hypothetical protein